MRRPLMFATAPASFLGGIAGSAALYGLFTSARIASRVFPAHGARDRARLASYAVSTVHAVVASAGGAYCYWVDDGGAFERPEEAAFGDSAARNMFLSVTAGYLAFDTALCAANRATFGDSLTIVHHAIILAAFGLGVATRSGTYYMAAFLVNELSTLPLNANYLMAASPRWNGGAAYKANGVLLLVMYTLARVVFNAYNCYHMVFRTWVPYAPVVWSSLTAARKAVVVTVSTLAFGHVGLNMIWYRAIVVAVLRKLRRGAPPRTKAQ